MWQNILFFICFVVVFTNLLLFSSFSVNSEDGCSGRLKYLLKMIKILSSLYYLVVLRFLKDNEKKLFRSLDRRTLKPETNKSHSMFNETCYNNDILANYRK